MEQAELHLVDSHILVYMKLMARGKLQASIGHTC